MSLTDGTSSLVSEPAQPFRIVGPARLHPDEYFQIDLGSEQLLHVMTRLGGDRLEQLAALADHDRSLSAASYNDGCVNPAQVAKRLELLDLYSGVVRHLIVQQPEQLLAQ